MNSEKDIQEKLNRVADEPGVYLMKDADGRVIYVGKARNLKKRIDSYFKNSKVLNGKTAVLVSRIRDWETIITRTEKEALILESNLIKRYRPRYNIVLKDDKRYPSLRIDLNAEYPNFAIVRKMKRDGARYFGPFASAHAVRQTLQTINKTFKLRKCRDREFRSRTRPCLHYQMDNCLAPCCLDVPPAVYREQVNEAVLFLKGRTPELIRKIRQQMQASADAQEFERAARLRDKVFSLERTIEKQVAVTTDFSDRDVFAAAQSGEHSVVTVLAVRGGFLSATRHYPFAATMPGRQELIGVFIRQYYERHPFVPPEVLVDTEPEDAVLIADLLKTLRGKAVRLHCPVRGEKARLVGMARHNAQNELQNILSRHDADMDLLLRLQKKLKLQRLPQRIECFDNSSIGGSEPVAGMVVFENGRANKSLYRKYRIREASGRDDYACMHEVLSRRLGNSSDPEPYPDLLMVDGGKGQLNIAVAVIQDLRLAGRFDLISIAKGDEKKGQPGDKIYKPARVNPVGFGRDEDLLLFLQRIRDEAHRFAIGYHRRRRGSRSLQSSLDSIAGVGPKRRAVLLRHFGSLEKIRAASSEEISLLPGFNRRVAESVHRALTAGPQPVGGDPEP